MGRSIIPRLRPGETGFHLPSLEFFVDFLVMVFYWSPLGSTPYLDGFYWVLLGLAGLYWVLMDFIRFCGCVLSFGWILEGFTGFDWVWMDFIRFYWVWVRMIEFGWVLEGFTGFYWALMGFTEC